MGQNYGYETLMTELPTYMKQVLRFSIKEVSIKSFAKSSKRIHFFFFYVQEKQKKSREN